MRNGRKLPVTTWEWISPEVARQYLSFKHPRQRVVALWRVEQYARDMASGDWRTTHQGIALSEDGMVLDGVHRLMAIIRAGLSILMPVTRGLADDSFVGIDRGRGREMHNNAEAEWLRNKKATSVTRAFFAGINLLMPHEKHTDVQLERFALEHEAALKFGLTCFPSTEKGITKASVQAAFARAFYYGSEETLKMAANSLMTGIIPGEDMASIRALRTWLSSPSAMRQTGGMGSVEAYGKTARALRAYLDGERLRRLYMPDSDPLPIPS